jgi:hypothetical protein
VRLFLLCLLSYAGFFSPGNSNVITRAALSLAIVQRHALTIDPLADFTTDRAFVDGAYYTDKAPGLSLLALPAVYTATKLLGYDTNTWMAPDGTLSPAFHIVVYLATLSTVGVLTALSVAASYRWSRRSGASHQAALLAALTLGLATPCFGWATVFFGHAASGALLLLGFCGLSNALDSKRRRVSRGTIAGLVLGTAFVIEFPTGPAVFIISVSCMVTAMAQRQPMRLMATVLVPATLGLIAALIPLLVYNKLAFGAPLRLGYASVHGFSGMQSGFFGLGRPDLRVARELLIGLYRGLLPLSPVLAMYPLAMTMSLRQGAWRLAAIVSVLVFLYYLLMNASYYYWNGGDSTGPRHLLPALPLLTLLFARLWDGASRVPRALFMALLVISAALSLACAATDMWSPANATTATIASLLARFLRGDIHRVLLAQIPSLHGLIALLPLLLGWGFSLWRLWPTARLDVDRETAPPDSTTR